MEYKLRDVLLGHTSDARTAIVLEDGITIVTGGRDRALKIWKPNPSKPNSYKELSTNFVHEHWILSLLSLENGKNHFASGCSDRLIRLFDEEGNILKSMGGHAGQVSSLSKFDDNNDLLISGSWDGSARIWNLKTFETIKIFGQHENAVSVLGLNNERFVTGSAGMQQNGEVVGFQIRLFSLNSDAPLRVFQDHQGPIRCLSKFSNTNFVSTSNDGTTKLYDIEKGCVETMVNPDPIYSQTNYNYCVSVNTSNHTLSVGSEDSCVRIWNPTTCTIVQEIRHPSPVWWTCYLKLTGDLITCCADGVVRLFTQHPGTLTSS